MLRHIHGTLMGGVGWGMLTSCSWYVDGWGGVGHVNVMFMVRGNFEKEHVAACCSRVLTLKQPREKRVTINMSRFMLT